jgi:predicted HicB family RNase H-like nuclease
MLFYHWRKNSEWKAKTMEYKGYTGEFDFDDVRHTFHGKVSNIQYPITFKGKSMESLFHDFQDAINDYLAWCKKSGNDPEEPFPRKKLKRLRFPEGP